MRPFIVKDKKEYVVLYANETKAKGFPTKKLALNFKRSVMR